MSGSVSATALLQVLPNGRVVDVSPRAGDIDNEITGVTESAAHGEAADAATSCQYCGGPAYPSRRLNGREAAMFFAPLLRCRRCHARYFDLAIFSIRCRVQ
jgi:hypothetical protein